MASRGFGPKKVTPVHGTGGSGGTITSTGGVGGTITGTGGGTTMAGPWTSSSTTTYTFVWTTGPESALSSGLVGCHEPGNWRGTFKGLIRLS